MINLPSLISVQAGVDDTQVSIGLIDKAAKLIDDYTVAFWLAVGALALILIIVLIAVFKDKKKLKLKQTEYLVQQKGTIFIPVEDPDQDIEVEFLTLKDKIIASDIQLGRKILEKIKNKGPQALEDIVAAFNKAQPEIKSQLKRLVKEERLMERYSRRLNRPDYYQGVLLEAWICFPDPDTLKDFIEMLASPDETIQIEGARLLSAMKDPQSLTLLTAALMWSEHFVPARVAEVFASMGTKGASLLAHLLPKIETKHKVRVLETIAKIEAPYPWENVSTCLKDKEPAIRAAAASALGAGKMIEGLQPLMMSASDENWQVRAAAAKALGMIGDNRALNVLEVLAQDDEGWVAASAKESLEIFAQA